ncbi:IgA Peptidase M64 [Mariniflexile rhizosphaerae]|uniref:M64 family metallopeptidase n=1 Tax=unclassified Mariniflexile TaxID=2643887 RepID=UPI000CAED1A4|nr:M64 family metallopeptidase [Mariniflexile sp. TRM1-10]AXP79639.1 IgA Peptidase M64 [Mariniflexile sp. TRM1-10]PLB17739.1 MAG: IgA Peptidase M64 family protein [Flavobacteriaceae bacterium FS1-H7996/R]
MKHILPIVLFFSFQWLSAQVFDVETIKNSGNNDKRINLVILSEGYQASELAQFKTDAINFTNAMFNQSPFKEYTNYFNVHIIKVPSNESGADHPGTATDVTEPASPILNVDTYFNATYDSYGKHRLLYYEIDGFSSNNTQAKIMDVLATNFPTYDQALILVNSSEYGGSGGMFPMAYRGFWGNKVIMHELGHSLFNLKDEYYPGDILAAEAINMTQETDPISIRWKNWLGVNGVGIYQYTCTTGNCADWYKPHQNCIMESIDKSFCSVCKEGMVEKIHSLISPINSYTPISNSITSPTFPVDFQLNLINPIPNTLKSTWTLNASNFANDVDNISLTESDLNTGANTLTVAITDATTLLKVDNHDAFHVYTVTWDIDNSALGIKDITSNIANYNIAMYPNPTNTFLNFKFESDVDNTLKVDIIGLDGKRIKTITISNFQTNQVDISDFSTGIYLTNFYSKNILIASKKLVKN